MHPWATYLQETQRPALLHYITESNRSLHALIELDAERGLQLQKQYCAKDEIATHPPLHNVPLAIKDNIAVEGFRLTCGSRILEKLRAPYSATAVVRLLRAGAVPIAKSNLDEFGMGSDSQHSYFGAVKNPWNEDYVPGGSSGGSAAAVAAGMVPAALGSDTGGSVRQPAAFCGVYGLKPTYGAISRFGLVAYASSLEGIGILAEDIDLLRTLLLTMRATDPLDQTTIPTLEAPATANPSRIGYITQHTDVDDTIVSAYRDCIHVLQELGYATLPIELPHMRYIAPTYYTIATAEASANLARYDGVKYGYRPAEAESPEEMTKQARTAGLGSEVQLRILLGNYVLREGFKDRYYLQAQTIRRDLRHKMRRLFQETDALLLPAFPTPPFRRGEEGLSEFQQKQADCYTCLANLTGQPALAWPVALHNELPVGMQLMSAEHNEELLLTIAQRYRTVYTPARPRNYPGPTLP